MAVVTEVTRIANPRRARRNRVHANRRRNRRRMSAKQIKFFGTARQRAALKANRRRKRNAAKATPHRNPKPKANRRRRNMRVVAKSNRRLRRKNRKFNPALLITLGATNPRKKNKKRRNNPVTKSNRRRRRNAVATPRRNRRRNRRVTSNRRHYRRNPVRRANRRHHRRNRRRNPARVVVVSPSRNRRHYRRHRRNPTDLFGQPLFGKGGLEMIGGGVLGVTVTKFIPTLLPSSITGGIAGSNIGRVVMSGVSAIVGAWLGAKVSPQFGQGMLFGGMMQTLSVALNAFLPSVYQQLNLGLGALVPGSFTVPQNPITAGQQMIAAAAAAQPVGATGPAAMSGIGRAFPSAF